MNTEQLKTAEEILEKHTGKSSGHVNDFSIYEQEAIQAMQDFASQESKRAVDEFKEKLKHALRIDLSIKIGDVDKLIDLIDKL